MVEFSQSFLREIFIYNDGKLYWKIKPSRNVNIGDRAGSQNNDGYRVIKINQKRIAEHRVIFMFYNGYLPDKIDHQDRNKLNNHIDNLRECTSQQNQYNRKATKNSSSKYKGVGWKKQANKWQAFITINGKNSHLGYYDNEDDAARAYDKAARERHGEFASPNFG